MPRTKKEISEKYNSAFAKRLRELLQEGRLAGVTQAVIAEHLKVTPQAVSRWCNGENEPPLATVPRIAKYFNVSTDWILGATDIRSSDADTQAVCAYTKLDELAVKALPKFEIHAFINGLFANGLEKELFSVHRWIKKSAGRSVRRNSLLDQLKSVSNGENAMEEFQELEPQEDWYIEQACEKLKCVESSIRQMYEAEKRFQQTAEENTERRMGGE